jgi:squalene cyclase
MLSLRWARERAWLVPVFAAGAIERLDERRFRMRNPSGGPATPSGSGAAEELLESTEAGVAFLSQTQRTDGSWRGFMLAPGASNAWITAHVAFLLEDVSGTRELRDAAARCLLAGVRRRPAWGYNHRVRNDSDSTAQAIIVLERCGYEVPNASVQSLLAARRESGGFATYEPRMLNGRPRSWWEMAHADVTLLVAEALRRLDRYERERREARDWLNSQVQDGVLPAYWWPSPAYSLWAQARTGFAPAATADAAERLLDHEPRPVFLAMLIVAALADDRWSASIAGAVDRLVEARQSDGSWRCAPCLRNTIASHPGGRDAPGPISADPYRAFSTAHAVAALWRAHAVLEARDAGPELSRSAPRQ